MAADSASRLSHLGSGGDGASSAERAPLLGGGQEVEAEDEASLNEESTVGGDGLGGVGTTFLRNLGAVEAFAIVVSIVIGSGVFTSPGSIDTNVPSPGAALLVWLVGGTLAWTGASTMAELGTAIPGEGMCISRHSRMICYKLGEIQWLTYYHRRRAAVSQVHLW